MSYSKFTIETTESHNFRQYDNTTYLSSSSCKFTYESGVWTACTLHFSSQTKPTTTTIITAAVVEYATPTAVATAKRHSENSDDDIFTKYDDTS